MERELVRVSEPWNGMRPGKIADYTGKSCHAEEDDGEQGGADEPVLLQQRGAGGVQPLLPFGQTAIFEFHATPGRDLPSTCARAKACKGL